MGSSGETVKGLASEVAQLRAQLAEAQAENAAWRRRFDEAGLRADDALLDAQANLEGVLDSALSGIVACTAVRDAEGAIRDFRFTLANPMSERMLGHSRDEMVGRTLLDLFPGNVESGLFDHYVRVAETGAPCEVEVYYEDDRLGFWLSVSAVRLGDGVTITFTDVSERKSREQALEETNQELAAANEELSAQAEELQASYEHLREQAEALALSERKLQGVFNQSFGFIGTLSPEGTLIDANEVAWAMTDVPREHVLGRPFWEGPWWRRDAAVQAQVREAVAVARAGETYHEELTYFVADGSARRVDFSLVPLKDDAGAVVMLIPQGRDVTAQRRTEASLVAQTAFAESIIQNVPTGIAFLDRELVYRVSNPIYSAFLELAPSEIIGRYLFDVVPGGEPQIREMLEGVLATGEPVYAKDFPFTFARPDGTLRHTYWDLVYFPAPRDEDGRVSGVLVLADEVSERVAHEHEQRELREQQAAWQRERIEALEESDQLKDQFLSILSHELRTPINAIMGFGSVLADELAGPLSSDQHNFLGKILVSADALLALIDDLLIMSRVQAGQFSINVRAMDFGAQVASVVETLRPEADKRGVALVQHLSDGLPMLLADNQRIGQVLTNLVGNAVKFTPVGGTVTVRAAIVDDALRCEVVDTGLGIAESDMPRLFQRFGQIDTSNTRTNKGTGLGLSIVKAIVETHGGEVGVASQPGHGSTFWFTLPLARVPA
jgi:PAS domain S-box-containing protein